KSQTPSTSHSCPHRTAHPAPSPAQDQDRTPPTPRDPPPPDRTCGDAPGRSETQAQPLVRLNSRRFLSSSIGSTTDSASFTASARVARYSRTNAAIEEPVSERPESILRASASAA